MSYLGKNKVLILLFDEKGVWAQKLQADQKVKALSEAKTVKSAIESNRNSARTMVKNAFGKNSVLPTEDVDHIIDLQLGGNNSLSNLQALDRSVNRSLGAQISRAIRGYDQGTVFSKFTISD